MRWIRLSALRFGPLGQWTGRLDQQAVVFLGRNEAGKSTMMELMCTLLFGGHRRKADTKRLIAWGSADAQIEGVLARDDGTELTVQRVLRPSGVKGSLTEGGRLQELEDAPLPWLAPVSRELYSNIYALSLYDLLFPRQEAWALTQDQLLGGTADRQLRPASQVREELYRQAMSLWRPDRRGKTRMEELEGKLRERYDQLNQAQQAQEQAGELEIRQQGCQQEIARLRLQQQRLQQQLEETMSLRDRAARLQEGRALLASAGDVEAFDALPQDVEGTLEALRGRQRALARQVAESGRSLAQMNEQMERFTFREERILEKAEEIDRLNAQLPMLQQSGQQLPELMEKAQQASAQAARYMTERLGDPFGLGQGNSLPLARLQEASAQALDAHMAHLRAKEQLADAQARVRSPIPLFLGIGGFICLTAAAYLLPPLRLTGVDPALGWGLSSVLAVLSVGAFAGAGPIAKRLRDHKTQGLREACQQAAQRDSEANGRLMEVLQPLSLQQPLRDDPGELAMRCQQYAQFALQEAELKERCRLMQDRSLQDCSQIQALAKELLPECGDDALANLTALKAALEDARRWREESEHLYQEMTAERGRLAELKRQQQQAVDEEQEILNLLYQVPGRDITEQMAEIRRRRQAARRGQAMLEDGGKAGLPPAEQLDQQVDSLQSELDETLFQLQGLYNSQGAMDQRLEQLRGQTPSEHIHREIEKLTTQQADMTHERDQQALLFALVKVSEQRFREQHQPDVVRRASSYLSQITSGRYSRIVMSEDQQAIRIYSPEAGEFIDPAKSRLSQGTIEQVFLSLRLGLVDHLDPKGETLPLLLDETFVNWDHDRLVRGLSVLAQVADRRQLILFTCHPWMLQAMEEAGFTYQLVSMEEAHV